MKAVLWTAAAALALAASSPAQAQDDSNASVLAAVDTFFDGLNGKNPDLMASVVIDGAIVASMMQAEGGDRARARTMQSTIDSLRTEESELNEVYWDPIVLVSGPIAVVWAPYSFDLDGERTHCGIDVFNLFRLDGAWKITSVQYTIEPDGCPAGR